MPPGRRRARAPPDDEPRPDREVRHDLTRFFRNALTLCAVLAACAFAAPAEAQVTGMEVQAIGPNKVRAKWNHDVFGGATHYQIAYDTQARSTTNYRFSTREVAYESGLDKQTMDITVPSDGHYGFLIRSCTGTGILTCGEYGAGRSGGVATARTHPLPMSGFSLTPGDATLRVDGYIKSPRRIDRNGAAFSRGTSRGYDIHYTSDLDVALTAGTHADEAQGWRVVRTRHRANAWIIGQHDSLPVVNFTDYRVRMRYISTNGTSAWIERQAAPGTKLSKPDASNILVHRRVRGLNVSGKTESGTAEPFSIPGAENYLIQICRGSQGTDCSEVQTSGDSGKLIQGLVGGAQYHIRVKARSPNGRKFDSDWSDWIGPITKPRHRLFMSGATYTVTEGDSRSHELAINEGGAITADLTVFPRYDPPGSGGTQNPAPAVIRAGTRAFPIVIPPDNDANDPHRTFHIRELVDADTYEYVMSSGNGQVAVTVLDDDAPTVTGLAVTVNVRTLEVRWDASAGPVTEYAVEYKKAPDSDWQSVTRTDPTATSEDLRVDGGGLYTVRVRANDGQTGDGNGWGAWVEQAAGSRTDYVVAWPQATLTINEGEAAARRLIVAKSVPARMTATVAYGGDNVSDLEEGRVTTFSAEQGEDLVVVLATPRTGDGNEPSETFTVTINNGAGYSVDDAGRVLTVTIEDNDPPVMGEITLGTEIQILRVGWTRPAGPVTKYELRYRQTSQSAWNAAQETTARSKDLSVAGGQRYTVAVRAHDGNGWGVWVEKTSAEPVAVDGSVQVTVLESEHHAVEIRWFDAGAAAGQKYEVQYRNKMTENEALNYCQRYSVDNSAEKRHPSVNDKKCHRREGYAVLKGRVSPPNAYVHRAGSPGFETVIRYRNAAGTDGTGGTSLTLRKGDARDMGGKVVMTVGEPTLIRVRRAGSTTWWHGQATIRSITAVPITGLSVTQRSNRVTEVAWDASIKGIPITSYNVELHRVADRSCAGGRIWKRGISGRGTPKVLLSWRHPDGNNPEDVVLDRACRYTFRIQPSFVNQGRAKECHPKNFEGVLARCRYVGDGAWTQSEPFGWTDMPAPPPDNRVTPHIVVNPRAVEESGDGTQTTASILVFLSHRQRAHSVEGRPFRWPPAGAGDPSCGAPITLRWATEDIAAGDDRLNDVRARPTRPPATAGAATRRRAAR